MSSEGDATQLALLKLVNEAKTETIDSIGAAENLNIDHQRLVSCLKSLEARGLLTSTTESVNVWRLTEEGEDYAKEGSPEIRILAEIKKCDDKLLLSEVKKSDWMEVGQKNAMRNKWVTVSNGCLCLADGMENKEIVDSTSLLLNQVQQAHGIETCLIQESPDILNQLNNLKKRKLLTLSRMTHFVIQKGTEFSLDIKEMFTDFTKTSLLNESWREMTVKPYNFNAAGSPPEFQGSIHPLMKCLRKFRNILIGMGFEEMDTQNWAVSSFWNFDALFQPQSHPVRDAHDTFFLKTPATVPVQNLAPDDLSYFESVRNTHQSGCSQSPSDSFSLGWRHQWKEEEAQKLLMRTHTTCCSSKMLRELGKQYQQQGNGKFVSRKLFSIDRVFRNETLDATHLAEFHQVEGVVAMEGASLATLIGVMKSFYSKIGITNLRFKPAYNPYTEPSMEVFGYHPILKKWTEIGNSGIFRPEMLKPMGLPESVSVLGWGLSLERPTMIRYGVSHIRELFGPKSKLAAL